MEKVTVRCKLQIENCNLISQSQISQQNQLYVANKKHVDSQWTQKTLLLQPRTQVATQELFENHQLLLMDCKAN